MDFLVAAELTLRARNAMGVIGQVSDRLGTLGTTIRGTQSALGGIIRNVAGLAVGYAGISALSAGFRGLVADAAAFESRMQSTEIGLASIVSAVEGISFEEARSVGRGVFDDLTTAALRSTATTQELFDIYAGIYGPIRAAGSGMSDILHITENTALAASALGVDLPQATRDIMMMARGTAGMQVRLFSALRSMGAIREDAEAFNHLTAAERVQRITAALAGFEEAGAAYATSLPGVTSSLTDILQQLRRTAFRPIFDAIARGVGEVNTRLLGSRDAIESGLSTLGERAAAGLTVFIDRALSGLDWITAHWDGLTKRFDQIVGQIRAAVPMVRSMLSGMVALSIGRQVVGGGLGAIASVGGGVGAIASLLGFGGGGAAAAGGTAAATGGAAAAGGAAAVIPGLAAALPGILAGLAGLMAIIAAGSALIVFFSDQWDRILGLFSTLMPVFEELNAQWTMIGSALWDSIRPILVLIGALLFNVLWPAFLIGLGALRLFTRGLLTMVIQIAAMMRLLDEHVITPFVNSIMDLWSQVTGEIYGRRRPGDYTVPGMEEEAPREAEAPEPTLTLPPTATTTVHNDFRGSRISVRQEFRDADPDRVLDVMADDIRRFAEQRIQSGFVPAFTR